MLTNQDEEMSMGDNQIMEQPQLTRTFEAKVVRVLSYILSLAVLWQAVRFCQGDIKHVFDIDQLRAIFPFFPKSLEEVRAKSGGMYFSALIQFYSGLALHYIIGIAFWMWVASAIRHIGNRIARKVEIGFQAEAAEYSKEMAERLGAETKQRQEEAFAAAEKEKERAEKKQDCDILAILAMLPFGISLAFFVILGIIMGIFWILNNFPWLSAYY